MFSPFLRTLRKILTLPTLLGSGKSTLTALRYAEWARLVDQNKSVSSVDFDPQDILAEETQYGEAAMSASAKYDNTRLLKIAPTYAYRNRRMTEKELYYEMNQTSEKWEDFRDQKVGDRDDPMIGTLHAEVLACHGLVSAVFRISIATLFLYAVLNIHSVHLAQPKLDRFSSTDACCYLVCGPFAFATDVIDGFLSPIWPCKSRRACIFPLFHAYQKFYAGVFDNDGAGVNDDFAGRVVVDIASLRPKSSYDVYLPLRLYQNTYIKQACGVIHLRLRLEWDNERKAILSYLKLPTKTKQLGNTITLNCADTKAFRNVVLTVQGKDIPGRFKQVVMKGLQREMKLYKLVMKVGLSMLYGTLSCLVDHHSTQYHLSTSLQTTMKEQTMDIIFWVHPLLSFSIFLAWMHCVYMNSIKYVPVYVLALLNALLVNNYVYFGKSEEYNAGFSPVTASELFMAVLFGGAGTKRIRPIQVVPKSEVAHSMRDQLDTDNPLRQSAEIMKGTGIILDGDHLEFPFSEKGRYAKKSLSEACVDSAAMFLEEDKIERSKSTSGLSGKSFGTSLFSIVLRPKY